MPLGTNHMTVTTAANFIPELWAMDVLEAAEAYLVMAKLVTDYSGWADGKEYGDTIHVPEVSNLVANDKTAGAQVTLQSPTESKVDILLNKHKEVSFVVEDIAKAQSKPAMREIYTKKAGYAIAKRIDSDLLALYAAAANSVAAGAAVSYSELLDAMEYLDLADVPEVERFLVINPRIKKDLLGAVEVKDRDFRTLSDPAPVMTGKVADILGCKVFSTNQVPYTTASEVNTYHNLMFNREAFALAIQMGPRAQAQYKQEYLGTLVTVDVVYGVKTMRTDHAVDIQST